METDWQWAMQDGVNIPAHSHGHPTARLSASKTRRNASWSRTDFGRGDGRRECRPHRRSVGLERRHLRGAAARHGLVVAGASDPQDVVDLPAVVEVLEDEDRALDEGEHVLRDCETPTPPTATQSEETLQPPTPLGQAGRLWQAIYSLGHVTQLQSQTESHQSPQTSSQRAADAQPQTATESEGTQPDNEPIKQTSCVRECCGAQMHFSGVPSGV